MRKLVLPSLKYKRSYLATEKEFYKAGEIKPAELRYYKATLKDFKSFLQNEANQRKGVNLRKGRVPQTRYWLIDKGEYVGFVSIRHKLNKHLRQIGGHIGYQIRPSKRKQGYGTLILKLALQKAKKLGIKKALITCDDDNIGSRKIIESNGGILYNKIKRQGKLIRRYWVTTQ